MITNNNMLCHRRSPFVYTDLTQCSAVRETNSMGSVPFEERSNTNQIARQCYPDRFIDTLAEGLSETKAVIFLLFFFIVYHEIMDPGIDSSKIK